MAARKAERNPGLSYSFGYAVSDTAGFRGF
jgi:hypothetical protein